MPWCGGMHVVHPLVFTISPWVSRHVNRAPWCLFVGDGFWLCMRVVAKTSL